ncbi:hypothetical protein NKR19_g2756 [Coniochaeta hoffmannii]|uniref:Uncharacterized protein n=1 Tax=Coniochaeta hoffmannii TaxID=91930 RepID=A0AA38VMP9_9PEZI|nr:hypothetical protein NKR19_g2756 [Coniochaeta hoffmannii]
MATGYSYSIKGGPAPSRPPRDFADSLFETAPPIQEPPPRNPKRNHGRNPVAVLTGSLHSQPRAIANVYMASRALHKQQDMAETISPPSSPEPDYGRRSGQQPQGGPRHRDVSPIDADRQATVQAPRSTSRNGGDLRNSQQDRTNIPMMRRMRRKQSDAALREAQARERQVSNPTSAQQRGEVRYDAMTGEPTASAAGRPPQVRPAEYAQGLGISTGSSPPQRSPGAMMTAFGDRASHAPPPPVHSANPQTLAPGDAWVQPPSRFSVTTYATSAANTPRESLDDFDHSRPPVPETPLQYRESSPQVHQSAYMSSPYHQQPPPSAAAQQRVAAATIPNQQHPALRNNTAAAVAPRTTADRPDSVASSVNKSLPPAPPETTAGAARDRVAMINAQLQGLGNRRINITRSIKQMTELMPTDSILDSADVIHRRELEKRKVEALKLELAEVRREEYELGLKLHRAYKRMDRDDNYEPTTLWVRRVTG